MAWVELRGSRIYRITGDTQTITSKFKDVVATALPDEGDTLATVAGSGTQPDTDFTPSEPEAVHIQTLGRTKTYRYISVTFAHDRMWA